MRKKVKKTPLVIINSPTATGKTKLAIELALEFQGEIINADSLQVYRYLDIGTAKPTPQQRQAVKHHLIDIVDPDEEYNAALFAQHARVVINNLGKLKKPVFVVGGTGLYIKALLRGIIATPPVDQTIRNHYRSLRDSRGKPYLFDMLQKRDPVAAGKINPNDSVRVIRALEVLDQTGESIAVMQQEHAFTDSPFVSYKVGLSVDREDLKRRIIARTERMIDDGLLEEVEKILDMGYPESLKPLQSLGYKQMIGFLRHRYKWDEAIELIKHDTWRYAKRQMTWFGADKEIHWFEPDAIGEIRKNIKKFLKNNNYL
ncbi:MAG TPA: tRNA (adenosine(37)-N6)-dimethylallyltransferase MiaA [Smithella sp.]|nr:tRNA (adenosine(37)-N6)-dimethylallyltransferase MiaA [Smithella sp.]